MSLAILASTLLYATIPPPIAAVRAPPDQCGGLQAQIAELEARIAQLRREQKTCEVRDRLTSGVRRIDPNAVGSDATRVSFERDPAGRRLKPGQNVETMFAPLGVLLESADQNSFVAADAYVVSSPSRGMSAANLSPRWTADIHIRFIRPTDSPEQATPRAVYRMGLHIAHVYPGGSGLEAYGENGALLARIMTRTTGSDFLGIASESPIARVRVFRVPSIDPNFTIDDLTFESWR